MKRALILVAASLALAATMGLTGSPADAGGDRGGSVVRVGGSFNGRFVSITTAIKDPIVPKGMFTLPPPPPQRRFPRGFSSVGVIASPVIVDATPPYPYAMYETPGYDYDSGGYYLWTPDGAPTYYPPSGYDAPPASYPPPMAYYPPPVAPTPTSYPSPAYNPPAAYDAPPASYPPVAYNPPPQPPAYNPAVYGQPTDRTVAPAPSAPSNPTVVQYPTGRYELRGDGMSSPITWVWIPNPPPPPPPPGPPPAGQVFSGDPSTPRRSQLYRWTDEQGVVHLTDRLEGVPPQYRGLAKQTPPS